MKANAGPTHLKSDITVVVPYYNRSAFAKRILESVATQTIQPECIYFVDNGSRSGEAATLITAISVAANSGLDARYVSSERTGNANIARNMGLDLAKTRYVAFLDSDDWWEPRHLERTLQTLQTSEKTGAYCGSIIHAETKHINASTDVNLLPTPYHLLFSRSGWSAQTSTYLVDKSRMGQVRWDESLNRHQDYDFFLAVAKDAKGWAFSDMPTGNLDRCDAIAGRRFDFKSMIKFLDKWRSAFPHECLEPYLLSQMDACLLSSAHPMYYKYYQSLLISTNDSLPTRTKSLAAFRKARLGIIQVTKRLHIHSKLKQILGAS